MDKIIKSVKMDNSNLNYKIVPKKYYVIEGDDETEGQSCENDFFNKLKCMTQSQCVGDDSIHDMVDTDNNCLLTILFWFSIFGKWECFFSENVKQ